MTTTTPLHVLRSSRGVYRGARVALLSGTPGAYEEDECAAYRVAVHTGAPHRIWEWQDGRTQQGPHRRGDVTLTALGERRRVQWDGSTALVSIELEPALLRDAAAGIEVDLAQAEIVGAFSRRDVMLEHFAFALVTELEGGLSNGRLFGEAVALAMATHLVREYGRGRVVRSRQPSGRLAPRTLANVVEYVRTSLADPIALADLAKLANLSAFHFCRSFRESTGLPPHAYVVRERVNEAIRRILGGATLGEAAAGVGFSSQGHLTRHMRRLVGVTPGALRRR